MSTMQVLRSGEPNLTWTVEDAAATAAANAKFDEIVEAGGSALTPAGDRLRAFDATAEQINLTPAYSGG